MKIRVLVAVGSLLTIGTAVAGSFMYGHGAVSVASSSEPTASIVVTESLMADWKASAVSTDYVAPKAPL
jgi:hypothetical protein